MKQQHSLNERLAWSSWEWKNSRAFSTRVGPQNIHTPGFHFSMWAESKSMLPFHFTARSL